MNINKISPSNTFGSKYFVPRKISGNCLKDRPYLNNEVLDLVKKYSVTSVFNNEGISLTNPTKEFLQELIEKGIKVFSSK